MWSVLFYRAGNLAGMLSLPAFHWLELHTLRARAHTVPPHARARSAHHARIRMTVHV